MSATPSVIAAFARLGTEPTRDVRIIKRAYAVALKAIDQASEREAFERLRQAYEQALAWAAREEDADDDGESEDEDNQDDGDGEVGNAGDAGDAGEGDDARIDVTPLAAPPGQPLAASMSAMSSQDEAREALRHWIEQLREASRDASPADVGAVLDAALADPRLLHLDSHAQLEARIAHLLHDDPTGRAALFDTAATRFHWRDRNARPFASIEVAHWISRVINQGLQWEAQEASAIALQREAIDTVTRVASPSPRQSRHLADVLVHMARDFPDWFTLHLGAQGHAHLQRWEAVHAELAAEPARPVEPTKKRPFRLLKRLVGGFFVLTLASTVLSVVMRLVLPSPTPSPATAPAAIASDKAAGGTPAAASEPVLAYEFTGALTRDSCESAEEFMHESNWLEVDDSNASALLATRAMGCQDKGFWSRKDDPLMACLRAERAAALAAGRPEALPRCLPPRKAGP